MKPHTRMPPGLPGGSERAFVHPWATEDRETIGDSPEKHKCPIDRAACNPAPDFCVTPCSPAACAKGPRSSVRLRRLARPTLTRLDRSQTMPRSAHPTSFTRSPAMSRPILRLACLTSLAALLRLAAPAAALEECRLLRQP